MARRKTPPTPAAASLPAPQATATNALTPQTHMHGVGFPGGSFQQSTGTGERLSWARSNVGVSALGWGANGGVLYNLNGGRVERDAVHAQAVANDIATSNPLIAALLVNMTTDALGTQLTLSSKPDAKALGITTEEARALSHEIETAWNRWASNAKECDFTGRFTLHQQAACVFRSCLLNGEAVATLEWRRFRDCESYTKVNLLDSTQLSRDVTRTEKGGINISRGVGFTQEGRLHGYALRRLPMGSLHNAPAATYVPAYTSWGRTKVIHILSDYIDARQVRGLSPLVGALTPANEHETHTEFTLANSLLQNQFCITIESQLPTRQALDGLVVNEHLGNTETWLSEREAVYGKAKVVPEPGVINHLAPSDTLKFNTVQNPNNNFQAFQDSLSRKTAAAAGVSAESLTKDFSKTSFSASRLATAQPHEINLRRRKDILEKFYREVFCAFLEEFFERGLIDYPTHAKSFYSAKDAWCNCKFLGKGVIVPDIKKKRESDVLALENGLATFTEIIGEDGKDFEAHIAMLEEERAILAKAGLNHPFFAGATTTQIRDEDIKEEPQANAPSPVQAPPAKRPTRQRAQRVKLERYIAPELSDDQILGL